MDKGSEVIKIVEWNLKGQVLILYSALRNVRSPLRNVHSPLRNIRSAVGNINKKLNTCKSKTGLYRNCNSNNSKIQIPQDYGIRTVDDNLTIMQ